MKISTNLATELTSVHTFDVTEPNRVFDAERRYIEQSVYKRRSEFLTVRDCARHALRMHGVLDSPLIPYDDGEPSWPATVVGSLTHCPGMCMALVGPRKLYAALGVDAEIWDALPDGVDKLTLAPSDQEFIQQTCCGDVGERIAFSAKEAAFKALYRLGAIVSDPLELSVLPSTRSGVQELRYREGGSFTVVEHTLGTQGYSVHGRWGLVGGFITTCVVVPSAAA